MVYVIRYYWVLGLCPSSGILKNTKEYDVSGIECFGSQVKGWETHILLGQ
jgi:hypothetical protein